MKRLFHILLCSVLLWACNDTISPTPDPAPVPDPVPTDGVSDISYQLLVYSFADSDGDGTGDFNGIRSKLDYLSGMGVKAIWLSPIHPATSYHGYDVEDYCSVNPQYGTEDDFKALLDAAHARGMKIYIDYVLNHSSKNHPWFLDATDSADSRYRDYYIISSSPEADVKAGKIPMIPTNGYNAGEWTRVATGLSSVGKVKFYLTTDGGKPSSLRMEKVDEVRNSGSRNTGIWLYYGDGRMEQFYQEEGKYTLSLELASEWGILIRTSTDSSWPTGTKYGGKDGENVLGYGSTIKLYQGTSSFDPADILLPGMKQEYYLSVFGSYMPDINYGAAGTCEQSPAFKALTEAADKWISMGVDGFRLDAVKHIYHNAGSDENPTFLKKFYEHCNASYHASGHSGNFYMVGEQFSEAKEVAPYYKGIPALFEFAFWWRLTECLNSGSASAFASTINTYHSSYATYRNDWIAATKLSNHDEDRAASILGRNVSKEKLAASVLLTCSGNPYIYQGEELGYWGTKSGGDEYVRTPIKWGKSDSPASAALGGKVDLAMLTPEISVEAQAEDENSILSLYRKMGTARATYKALSSGSMVPVSLGNQALACWTREYDGQKVLVIHNFNGLPVSCSAGQFNLSKCIVSNGKVSVNGSDINISGYSSAIFLQ